MSKFSRIVVLVTALASLFAVMSSTAGATTWINHGGTAVHASGGNGTLTVTRDPGVGSNLSCSASTATGNVPMDFTSVTGTITFAPCSLSGTASTVACHFTLTPTTFTAATQAITSGIASVTCTAALTTGTALCHIEGNTPGHYINPDPPNTVGRLTLTASSTLTVTHSNATHTSCSALLGTTTSGLGHLSEQTLNLTAPASSNPIITGV
jgi:hypothetical protein